MAAGENLEWPGDVQQLHVRISKELDLTRIWRNVRLPCDNSGVYNNGEEPSACPVFFGLRGGLIQKDKSGLCSSMPNSVMARSTNGR